MKNLEATISYNHEKIRNLVFDLENIARDDELVAPLLDFLEEEFTAYVDAQHETVYRELKNSAGSSVEDLKQECAEIIRTLRVLKRLNQVHEEWEGEFQKLKEITFDFLKKDESLVLHAQSILTREEREELAENLAEEKDVHWKVHVIADALAPSEQFMRKARCA